MSERIPRPNTDQMVTEMDAARMAQDHADQAARLAGQNTQRNAVTRNEFLLNPKVQEAVLGAVIAPVAGEIFAAASRDRTTGGDGMKRLQDVLAMTPAETKAYEQRIEANIGLHRATGNVHQPGGQPTAGADIAAALTPEENWFYSNFMRAQPGRPQTKLDKRLQAVENADVLPGMNETQWDILNNSVDYTSGLAEVLRDVNTGVNRKMGVAMNNAELFAQDPATLSAADRKKLEAIIMRTDISQAEYKVMQQAAVAEVRRTQGADVTPETTINARTQAHVDSLRAKLLEANKNGDNRQVDDIQQEIQRVLADNVAARKRAQEVGRMNDEGSMDTRHQARITKLEQNIQAATSRGDTQQVTHLQQELQNAQAQFEGVRYSHLHVLREKLTARQLKRLAGGEADRAQVDLDGVIAANAAKNPNNAPAGPGGPTNPNNNPNADPRGPLTPELLEEAYKIHEDVKLVKQLTQEINSTRSKYIEESAKQRSSHLGRLEATGSRFSRFMKNMVRNGVSRKKSEASDAAVETARLDHRQNFKRLFDATLRAESGKGKSPDDIRAALMDLSVKDYSNIEQGIQEQRTDGATGRIARTWSSRSRATRGLIVGAPSGTVGAAGGLLAAGAALSLPVSAALGLGIGYGARKYGQRIAVSANRGAGLEADVFNDRLTRGVAALTGDFKSRAGQPNEFAVPDHTTFVEAASTAQVRENQRRRGTAGMVGSLAAGIGFGLGNIAGNALSSAGGTGTESATPPPASGTEVGTAPAVTPPVETITTVPPGVDVNSYPWTVAHGMTPGTEFATMQHAMDSINAASNGATNLHFMNYGGFTHIANGSHLLNAAQQAQFNTAMLLGV